MTRRVRSHCRWPAPCWSKSAVRQPRSGLDRLLERYRQHLASASGRPGGEPGWFDWQLKHDPDGVWYLQAGIYGPALAVTEQWIVISYSPVAVRQNLAYLKRIAAQPIRLKGKQAY